MVIWELQDNMFNNEFREIKESKKLVEYLHDMRFWWKNG